MVVIKIGVLLMFVVLGLQGWNSDNLSDFSPFGIDGITSAAGIIFFSYIGPRRRLDRGRGGAQPAPQPASGDPLRADHGDHDLHRWSRSSPSPRSRRQFEGQEAGLSAILEEVTGSTWPATILAAGAVISIFSVTLVTIYGQTRILFAMGRDGMVPPLFHRLNPRTLTPVPATIIAAVVIALLAGVLPIEFLAEMTSIGTLVAFLIGLDRRDGPAPHAPNLPRGFKVPGYPVTPILSIAGCIWIIQDLRAVTIYVFFGWSAVALLWYAFYGKRQAPRAGPGRGNEARVMTFVVGFAPEGRGRAVHLAGMLARSAGDDLVLCASCRRPGRRAPRESTRSTARTSSAWRTRR